VDNSHVKPKSEFSDGENDEHRNIIKMCKNHHDQFDNGNIGICPDERIFVFLKDGELVTTDPNSPIGHIKREYIIYKNKLCNYKIRLALGMVNSQSWNSMCHK